MSRKKKKTYIPIQTLIAYNNTDAALKLLEKNGYKAKDIGDLQVKLTEFYRDSPDKMEAEKALVEIHPHKDLILKHLAPKEEKQDKTIVEVAPTEKSVNEHIKNTVVHDGYSSCEGSSSCPCSKKQYSNACGCSSGFDGTGKPQAQTSVKPDNSFNSIVVLGIVAIFGMLIYKNKI